MSDTIDCPNCKSEHDGSDLPPSARDRFRFECEECGAEFTVYVDWHPSFFSGRDGMKLPPQPHPLTDPTGGSHER